MKALEKLAEARDKYQVGDLVTIHAAGMGLVGQVVKATKAKATVRLLEGLGTARRPSWADRLEDLDWEAVTGALSGPDALEALELPAPPDVQAIAEKLEAAPEQTQEAGMQLPNNNQQMRDQLLSALSQEDSQAIVQVANERRRLAAGEMDAQAFEETARQVLGFDLPADWNGAVQVQGNVVIEDGGEQFVEPAHAVGREPEFWGVYAQHENGMHQWVADLNSHNQADELANLLGLVDALSETNEPAPGLRPRKPWREDYTMTDEQNPRYALQVIAGNKPTARSDGRP